MKPSTGAAQAAIDRVISSRISRYQVLGQVLPYVARHVLARPFRSADAAKQVLSHVANPEHRRLIYYLYCDMFLHGYRESTGYRPDRDTGLMLVLFVLLMTAADDELERRYRAGSDLDSEAILATPGPTEMWTSLGSYLEATKRNDDLRIFIRHEFVNVGYSEYCSDLVGYTEEPTLATAIRLAQFDTGEVFRTAYHLIRLFNGHPEIESTAAEFYSLGMVAKYLDDIADYRQDAATGGPNLLRETLRFTPDEFATVDLALAADSPMTIDWWRLHCPSTYREYMQELSGYYGRIRSPSLRIPLNVYLSFMRSRWFWKVSTTRSVLG